ncbi:MAG: Asp-tRNA(Asn)/Glu-tRNA(Gln) amidotransferase GatCAB subunit C [Flavobacteriales bacterium]|nr:Asp-tRNA(Asn)/Glu-tRNA(Gln) amidotransferase GatCAB subunit C [Flavobacteriales bacterium]|tara:strand:- start:176 stop:466 length:291 start_codon:yes stop_codon:yes gene_type:complete
MKVNNNLIKELSILSKIQFDKNSSQKMKEDLVKILEFIEKLNEVDTDETKPLVYVSEEKNILRKDICSENYGQHDALQSAPQKDSDYFKVPKIIKK